MAALRLPEALGALSRYSLISPAAESIALHRLLQAVVSGRLSETEQATWAERAMKFLLDAWPKNLKDITTWPQAGQARKGQQMRQQC